MPGYSTYTALLARGFNSTEINSLINQGYSLSKLQMLSTEQLSNLGIALDLQNRLQKTWRAPIPESTLIKLLHDSRYVCCICRDRSNGVVIHHINEWSISHDNSESNLVVLCPNDHDKAHSKGGLSLNLTVERLKDLKAAWIKEVEQHDKSVMLNIVINSDAQWAYFNHNRVFGLYLNHKLSNKSFRATERIKTLGLIDPMGTFLISNDPDEICFYHFQYGFYLRYYMHEMLCSILHILPFIDITDKFTKSKIKQNITVGSYIGIQAAFYFHQKSKSTKGIGQERIGYYKKKNVKIEFSIDPYECTSVSSYCCHLSGHRIATVFGLVTSIVEDAGILTIAISCFGIGFCMPTHEYWATKSYQGYDALSIDEEDY